MKRIFLFCTVVLTWNSFAAQPAQKESEEEMQPWSEPAKKRLQTGLEWTLSKGKEVPKYETNGVYKIILRMQQQLQTVLPHQLPSSKLAQQFLIGICDNQKYTEVLALAKQKHKASLSDEKIKAESEKTWTAFRIAAAQVLTEYVEARSTQQAFEAAKVQTNKTGKPFKFNRGPENIKDIFLLNAELDPQSHDGQNLEAATLSLYGLLDVQEREKALTK